MIRAKAERMTDAQLGADLQRIDHGIRVTPDQRSLQRWQRRRQLIETELIIRETVAAQTI